MWILILIKQLTQYTDCKLINTDGAFNSMLLKYSLVYMHYFKLDDLTQSELDQK